MHKMQGATRIFEICQYKGCDKPSLNGKFCSRQHATYGHLVDYEPDPLGFKPVVKRGIRPSLKLKYKERKLLAKSTKLP